MSMYEVACGANRFSPLLLNGVLDMGLKSQDELDEAIPRFRDVFITNEGGEVHVAIFTRTGGGNRTEYAEENESLRQIAGFARDENWVLDNTYAIFYYKIEDKEKLENLMVLLNKIDEVGYLQHPTDKHNNVMKQMKKG